MTVTDPVALIADDHGNAWAFDAVLADIDRRGIREIINLGDSLDGPLDPLGTYDRFRALGDRLVVNIRGNGERVLAAHLESGRAGNRYDGLGDDGLAWLRSAQPTARFEDVFCCHGTPVQDTSYLMEEVLPGGGWKRVSPEHLADRLRPVPDPVIACAHSHLARTIRLPDGRLVVNPGSVGLPAYSDDVPYAHAMESGSPKARYAILWKDELRWQVEPVSLIYPWDEAANAAREHDREDWAKWLSTGCVTGSPE